MSIDVLPRHRNITVAAVRAALFDVAGRNPRRVDPLAVDGEPTRYVVKGRPSCLVAAVLHRLGYSTAVLRSLDHEHPTGEIARIGVPVSESRHKKLNRIEPAARALLQYVQDAQDRGKTWGAVVDAAFRRSRWRSEGYLRQRKPWLFE